MNELVILSTECLCFQEASPRGSTFQAMVSVMAVKIQLSSPRGVRLSLSLPGILQRSATQMEECQRRQTVLHVAQVTHSKNSHRADSAQCDWASVQLQVCLDDYNEPAHDCRLVPAGGLVWRNAEGFCFALTRRPKVFYLWVQDPQLWMLVTPSANILTTQ